MENGLPITIVFSGRFPILTMPCSHTRIALSIAQPKMAVAIFGFGLTHAPDKDSELVRKYRQIWKVTPK